MLAALLHMQRKTMSAKKIISQPSVPKPHSIHFYTYLQPKLAVSCKWRIKT